MAEDDEHDVRKLAGDVVGLWNWSFQSGLVTAEEKVCEYFDLPPSIGMLGVPLHRFIEGIHADDREAVTHHVAVSLHTNRPFEHRYRVSSRKFGIRSVQACGRCFRNERDQPVSFPGVIIDDVGESSESSVYLKMMTHMMAARGVAADAEETMLVRLMDAVLLEVGIREALWMNENRKIVF